MGAIRETNAEDFKYDVAFSLTNQDEALATAINDLIRDRLSTFLWTERQAEIAGTDGIDSFTKIFAEQSRVVVVLYREDWGKTKWTRIEQTAIRNRGYEDGFDFVTFVIVEKNATVPKWLPKTRLWHDLERYGAKGAAIVIGARVTEAGGTSRGESVADQAARLKRRVEAEAERRAFLDSNQGASSAQAESRTLFALIEETARGITCDVGLELAVTPPAGGIGIQAKHGFLRVSWYCEYANTLNRSRLTITLWDRTPGALYIGEDEDERKPTKLRERRYGFDREMSGELGWRSIKDEEFFLSARLAEKCVSELIEYSAEEEIGSQNR